MRIFYSNGVRYSVLVPGVQETLATLAGMGLALGVATSDGTSGTRAALANLGLEDLPQSSATMPCRGRSRRRTWCTYSPRRSVRGRRISPSSATTRTTSKWRAMPAQALPSACLPVPARRRISRRSPMSSSTASASCRPGSNCGTPDKAAAASTDKSRPLTTGSGKSGRYGNVGDDGQVIGGKMAGRIGPAPHQRFSRAASRFGRAGAAEDARETCGARCGRARRATMRWSPSRAAASR